MPLMLFDVSCYVCKMEEIIETSKSVYFSPGPLISVVGNICIHFSVFLVIFIYDINR